jgi:acyl carrier protein
MTDTRDRIKRCIVQALDLPIAAADLADDAEILGLPTASGGSVDSLAALEILVALGSEFNLPLDDVPQEVFQNLGALTAYVEEQLAATRLQDEVA